MTIEPTATCIRTAADESEPCGAPATCSVDYRAGGSVTVQPLCDAHGDEAVADGFALTVWADGKRG